MLGLMPNEEHIRILLQGYEVWNKWRVSNPDLTPDLSQANLSELVRAAGPVTPSGRPNLGRFSFTRADMTRAILTDAYLARSDFSNAVLFAADLTRACLWESDLSNTHLQGAIFHKANLSGTLLEGAKVELDRLLSADILFRTILSVDDVNELEFDSISDFNTYWMPRLEYPADLTKAGPEPTYEVVLPLRKMFEQISIKAVHDFVHELSEHLESLESRYPKWTMYFRGEECDHWTLRPKLSRECLQPQESSILENLELAEPSEFANDASAIGRLTLAQHHGLPTRMIDVTRNPMVALYFASRESGECGESSCSGRGKLHAFIAPPSVIKPSTSDTVSLLASFALLRPEEQQALLPLNGSPSSTSATRPPSYTYWEDGGRRHAVAIKRLQHFVGREKPYFEDRIDPRDFLRVIIVEPKSAFPRIRAQSGAMLLSAFHEDFGVEAVINAVPSVPHYNHSVYFIPKDAKKAIRKQLGFLNVNEHTLFPGLEGAAAEVTRRAKDLRDSLNPSRQTDTGDG